MSDVTALRLLIVARDIVARTGLAAMLETRTNCEVVGRSAGGAGVTDDLRVYEPDVVLLDLGWAADGNLDDLSVLSESEAAVVALLPDAADGDDVLTLLKHNGGYGLLLRENETETLALALESVFNGLVVLDPALTESLLQSANPITEPINEPLTGREHEVLQLLAQGLTNKAIAHELGITDHTVKFHVNAIMTKVGAQSRTEAVVRATRAGLIIL